MTSVFHQLEEYINGIWVVDTHEHIPPEEQWLVEDEGRLDFSQLMHYVDLDIISAGMPVEDMKRVRFSTASEDEKWALFEPWWEKAQNTSYAKVIDWTVRDFYGLPGLNRDTYKEIGIRIRELRKPGWYKHVLTDTAHIVVSILDICRADVDRDLFAPVLRLDYLMSFQNRQELDAYCEYHNVSINSLLDLEAELSRRFSNAVDSGVVAIKTAQAYTRGLDYACPSRQEAEKAFDRAYGCDSPDRRDVKLVWDYTFCRLIELCIDCDLPIQIHTGIAAGNATSLSPTNPLLLTDIFLKYPQAKFDLFHAGYPYCAEVGVLVKTFPNLRADLCWTHMISPVASRRALDEWLELVPANKIFGFGGDLGSVEVAASHLKLARRNIAMVLSQKVNDGYFTVAEAERIASMILHDNPAEFFRLTPQK